MKIVGEVENILEEVQRFSSRPTWKVIHDVVYIYLSVYLMNYDFKTHPILPFITIRDVAIGEVWGGGGVTPPQ